VKAEDEEEEEEEEEEERDGDRLSSASRVAVGAAA